MPNKEERLDLMEKKIHALISAIQSSDQKNLQDQLQLSMEDIITKLDLSSISIEAMDSTMILVIDRLIARANQAKAWTLSTTKSPNEIQTTYENAVTMLRESSPSIRKYILEHMVLATPRPEVLQGLQDFFDEGDETVQLGVLKAAQTLEHPQTLKLPIETLEAQLDTGKHDLVEAILEFAILISIDAHQANPLIQAIFEKLTDFEPEFIEKFPLSIGYICNLKHLEEDEALLNEFDNYPVHLRELFVSYCLEATWPSVRAEWKGEEAWSPAMQQHLEDYKMWLASSNKLRRKNRSSKL